MFDATLTKCLTLGNIVTSPPSTIRCSDGSRLLRPLHCTYMVSRAGRYRENRNSRTYPAPSRTRPRQGERTVLFDYLLNYLKSESDAIEAYREALAGEAEIAKAREEAKGLKEKAD